MINLQKKYQQFCESQNISFQLDDHVRPYDDSTLFCPAGMQQFKNQFKDPEVKGKTIANIQSCLRLNDYDEVGDGTHLLYFNMIGLFSFRHLTVPEAIHFWVTFLHDELKLPLDYVTIHPDKIEEWSPYYHKYQTPDYYPNLKIRPDQECQWTDGTNDPSYCTEFYIDDVEVGNIVNPNGDCIDVGFGYERLNSFLNKDSQSKQQQHLHDKSRLYSDTAIKIISSGYRPGPNKQGYVLRKILRDLVQKHQTESNQTHDWIQLLPEDIRPIVQDEVTRQAKVLKKYKRLRKKFPDRPDSWWYETHGIDRSLLDPLLKDSESISQMESHQMPTSM